jgi:hypothetical protein
MEFRVDEGIFGIIALIDLNSAKSYRIWKVGTRFELGSRARVTIIYTMYKGHISNSSINPNSQPLHSEGDVAHPRKLQSNELVEEDKTFEWLAKEFAAKVPKLKFSPTEILSFLLEYKQSPREAVDNVEVWITRIMKDRKKAKNKEKRFVSLC